MAADKKYFPERERNTRHQEEQEIADGEEQNGEQTVDQINMIDTSNF